MASIEPVIDFGREICGDLDASSRREWLVTNGIGGYASGTISSVLTRRYHGLLIAALKPPVGRTLLLAKLDETANYNSRACSLFTNRWASGTINPSGFLHLERFHVEGTIPVWTYAFSDALLQKRVWMQAGANTTYVRYDLCRAICPMTLNLRALVNYRDHHGDTRGGWWMQIEPMLQGLRVTAFEGATPFYLLSDAAWATPHHDWYTDFFLSTEEERGLNPYEDHLCVGVFTATLNPGDTLTVAASVEAAPSLDGVSAYAERQEYERGLIVQSGHTQAPGWVRQLVLAADQFIVRRPLPEEPGDSAAGLDPANSDPAETGHTVIAGYHWFADWGRDTMISLPGLTLTTGRPEVAGRILRTFARFVDQGMLPNRFPEAGEPPLYNTIDATVWYFEAIRAYHAATGDDELLRELFPVLEDIIAWHLRGTRYNIHVDPDNGLLYGGEPGWQLTWMDAKVGDWVVTGRIGKPVEVNALWYNGLRIMADFADRLGKESEEYQNMAEKAQMGFARFWNESAEYCYDVIDGPGGDDPSLRPNQLLAVSLPHSPLDAEQQRAVVDACARRLLTSHGLRSLAPDDPAYAGLYRGDLSRRHGAYHQGTVWGWFIGPFVSAHLRVYGDPALARSYVKPLVRHLAAAGLGSISEIFDGDPPFAPRGCIAQAWSVAEVLRLWQEIEGFAHPSSSSPRRAR